MLPFISNILKPSCVWCKYPSEHIICDYCLSSIDYFNNERWHFNLFNDPRIAKALAPHTFDSIHAISEYRAPISRWVSELKFSKRLLYANVLAACFIYSIRQRSTPLPQALLPVPLHYRRYTKRLFNQALEIARVIASELHCAVLDGCCVRNKYTMPQTDLSRQQRLSNVKNAFSVLSFPDNIKHIAIVDDVITTGSTAQQLCRAVKQANPYVKVEVWCMAISLSRIN